MIKISELQSKDVVNILDGRNLGSIVDLDIDLHRGRVASVVCPGQGKLFGLFAGGEDIVIPWQNIIKVGSDVILVRLDDAHYLADQDEQKHQAGQTSSVYKPYSHT